MQKRERILLLTAVAAVVLLLGWPTIDGIFFVPISENQFRKNFNKGSSRMKIFLFVLNFIKLVEKRAAVQKEFFYNLIQLDLAPHVLWKLFKRQKLVFEVPFKDWLYFLDFPEIERRDELCGKVC